MDQLIGGIVLQRLMQLGRYIANAVKAAGGLLVMGSDSHVAFSLGEFEKAIEVIETMGFPIERLLNRSPEALLSFLTARGHKSLDEYSALID
jgi:putative hydrolase